MEALHRQVLPFLLRRMKEDVLQDLPPKIIQDYYCILSPLQVCLKSGWKPSIFFFFSTDTRPEGNCLQFCIPVSVGYRI